MTTYTDMSAGDMLKALGTDAQKWAEAFCGQFPDVPQDAAFGWFANAMMNMWDVTNSEITHNDTALADHISNLIRNRDFWRELAEGNEAAGSERSEAPGGPQ